MRSDSSDRVPRRSLYRVIAGDWRRAAIASGCLAAILALAFFVGGRQFFGPKHEQASAASAGKDGKGWGHRVGSILFMPVDGDTCEQRRFDNATGRMLSAGTVKCSEGIAPNASGEPNWAHDNKSRINAILRAFKK